MVTGRLRQARRVRARELSARAIVLPESDWWFFRSLPWPEKRASFRLWEEEEEVIFSSSLMLHFYQEISSVSFCSLLAGQVCGVLCLNVLGTISLLLVTMLRLLSRICMDSIWNSWILEMLKKRRQTLREGESSGRSSSQRIDPFWPYKNKDDDNDGDCDDDDDSNLSSLKILGFRAWGLCNCNFAKAEENGNAFFFLPSSGIMVKLTMIGRKIPIWAVWRFYGLQL